MGGPTSRRSDIEAASSSDGLAVRQDAPCALHAHYTAEWTEGGYRRWEVTATAKGPAPGAGLDKTGWNTDGEMLKAWCDALARKYMHTVTMEIMLRVF